MTLIIQNEDIHPDVIRDYLSAALQCGTGYLDQFNAIAASDAPDLRAAEMALMCARDQFKIIEQQVDLIVRLNAGLLTALNEAIGQRDAAEARLLDLTAEITAADEEQEEIERLANEMWEAGDPDAVAAIEQQILVLRLQAARDLWYEWASETDNEDEDESARAESKPDSFR